MLSSRQPGWRGEARRSGGRRGAGSEEATGRRGEDRSGVAGYEPWKRAARVDSRPRRPVDRGVDEEINDVVEVRRVGEDGNLGAVPELASRSGSFHSSRGSAGGWEERGRALRSRGSTRCRAQGTARVNGPAGNWKVPRRWPQTSQVSAAPSSATPTCIAAAPVQPPLTPTRTRAEGLRWASRRSRGKFPETT